MTIAEMNKCIEKMRRIYGFDDENTDIELVFDPISHSSGGVELRTTDKNGIQIRLAGAAEECAEL